MVSLAGPTDENQPRAASSYLHKALAATSGAVGGSFGLPALPIELLISTVIMLRSIGDVARAEGEDLHDPETALSCLQVFALGGLTMPRRCRLRIREQSRQSSAEARRKDADHLRQAEHGSGHAA
jgi:EcsC protein family